MATVGFSFPSPLDVLSRSQNFRNLDAAALAALVAVSTPVELSPGQALFRTGEPFGRVVYILYGGHVRQRWSGGEERHAHLGDFLGLANYLDGEPHKSTAEAMTHCALLGIAADTLDELEQDHSTLFQWLNRVVAQMIRDRNPVRDLHQGALAQPVRNIMTAPVTACSPQTRLDEALTLMQQRHIGSLVVTDAARKLMGLLTPADLADAMVHHQAKPNDPIHSVYQRPHTVEPLTPLWQAKELLQHHRAKYLVVVDQGLPIGLVSQTDILSGLWDTPGLLIPHIAQATSLDELAILKTRLVEEATHVRESNRWASDAVRFLSETHLAIQRRVIDLTLDHIHQSGDGAPPVRFAIIIMGSGGRKEMTLDPDQDNGLIIADEPTADHPSVQAWFERFAEELNLNLAGVGYRLCPGDIMVRNPQYRHTLSQWKAEIDALVNRPTEEAARGSNIIFDFNTLYGDDHLTADLWRPVLERVHDNRRLLMRMAEDDARGRPALGLFNQLVATTRDDTGVHIDLKRNGLRLIADATRTFALNAGVALQNTMDRLDALVRTGVFSEPFSASVGDAYDAILDLLVSHQIDQARAGEPFDTLIDPKSLTEPARVRLRLAMRMVKRLQDHLQKTFGITVYGR